MNRPGTRRIAVKRHLRTEVVPGEGACLISPRGTTALCGAAAERLLPLLDGTRTLADVVAEVRSELSAAQVGQVLGRLTEADLINYRTGAPREDDVATEGYWDLAGLDGPRVATEINDKVLAVLGVGGADTSPVMDICRGSGLAAVEAGGGPADLCLVLCDDYLDPAMAGINACRLAEGRAWMPAKPAGADLWVGPVFRPGEGPCWRCLAERLRLHRHPLSFVRHAVNATARPPETSLSIARGPDTAPSISRGLGMHLAVLEAVKWLAGIRHESQDALSSLDTITMGWQHHPVDRRPQCPSCGDPEIEPARAWRPIVTATHPDRAPAPSAGQVLERYGHLADPVTGIVGPIRRDRRVPPPFHGYLSGHNLAITDRSISAIRASLRMQSGGKGLTDDEARAGALGEAVERYCGTRLGGEPTVRSTFRELGDLAVHPNSCQLFHERQFEARDRWNSRCAMFQRIPEPFDENRVIDWTPLWSLTERRNKLLPTDMLYYQPAGGERAGLWADSNGNAAGADLEDGIVRGFLELVERDAVAMWWYNRTRQPAVDLRSFPDDWIAPLRDEHRRIGREFWVVDVTSDLAIPAMAAISRRSGRRSGRWAEGIVLGFGAHFDPRVALRRALAELSQLLAVATGGGADGTEGEIADRHLRRWLEYATTDNQPYLRPDPGAAPRHVDDYRRGPRPGARNGIDHICALARRHGLDILVLDQTRPDVGLPVVKVVAPGLRHFWARFAPGRLYDVPVRLGRLAEPTPYEKLNPIPMFF